MFHLNLLTDVQGIFTASWYCCVRYTPCLEKGCFCIFCLSLCQLLTDLLNSFTGRLSSIFVAKNS